MRALVLSLLIVSTGCLVDRDMKPENKNYTPDPTGNWKVATPAEVGMDATALDRLFDHVFAEDEMLTVRSVLIARQGQLVAEAYTRDSADATRLHHLQSATKTVTSILAGIAIDEGLLSGPDVTIGEVLPGTSGATADTTLRDLLSMKAGLEFDNGADTEPLINDASDSVTFVLDKPRRFPPGHAFLYNDGSPHIVSAMIQQSSGMPLEAFADEHLFEPLGITTHRWERHRDGTTYGAFGLWLRPRDMLRIGQMVLDEGEWNGESVVSPTWLEQATQVQATPFAEVSPYGWYWWVKPDMGMYTAIGHGGQFISVFPDQDLVLVITADPYTDALVSYLSWDLELFFTELIDTVRP